MTWGYLPSTTFDTAMQYTMEYDYVPSTTFDTAMQYIMEYGYVPCTIDDWWYQNSHLYRIDVKVY